ncbi:hypothetical protein NDU88_002620 [Pleurodeles waltl]|uniref:Uncharacterized protein n=1 Tax=Pleurodeles waltl TaxID=8319 RepID=A0AAV7M4P7_PLEWA|nr:hypothetical protein NDU88_002620 [Pleurodeles waltl]
MERGAPAGVAGGHAETVAGPNPRHLLYRRKKNKTDQMEPRPWMQIGGAHEDPKKIQQHIGTTRREGPKAKPRRALKLGKQPAVPKVSGHRRVAESWRTGGAQTPADAKTAHDKLKCPADQPMKAKYYYRLLYPTRKQL